jgi:hypothetical protein
MIKVMPEVDGLVEIRAGGKLTRADYRDDSRYQSCNASRWPMSARSSVTSLRFPTSHCASSR